MDKSQKTVLAIGTAVSLISGGLLVGYGLAKDSNNFGEVRLITGAVINPPHDYPTYDFSYETGLPDINLELFNGLSNIIASPGMNIYKPADVIPGDIIAFCEGEVYVPGGEKKNWTQFFVDCGDGMKYRLVGDIELSKKLLKIKGNTKYKIHSIQR